MKSTGDNGIRRSWSERVPASQIPFALSKQGVYTQEVDPLRRGGNVAVYGQ